LLYNFGTQPAIFVASIAAVEKLKQEQGQEALDAATCAMGLSLGEYSALCFSGALSFADGVKITKARGEAMQAASDAVDSGMVSVIGLDSEKVKELCAMASEKSGEKIQIANYLCKGYYAVSGSSAACDSVAELAKPEFKARMTVKLTVAGAFHTGKINETDESAGFKE
jgi:[acyl-carrier-protein] S-malonyltransferase